MGADRVKPSGSQLTDHHPEEPGRPTDIVRIVLPGTEQVLPDVIKLIEARPELLWIHPGRRFQGSRGFPDLLIAGHRVIVREVKPSQHVQLDLEQIVWQYRLFAAGLDCHVWGREQLEDGTIERELDELR